MRMMVTYTSSSQLLEPRGITIYSEEPYVVGSGQLSGP